MHKPIKILIVEDEAIIALYLETVLCSTGYTVTATAVSGEQALQCVEQGGKMAGFIVPGLKAGAILIFFK